jgi:hypothetical protein
MILVRGVLGAILAFLGREMNFLFAGGFAAMIALRVVPLLPGAWPSWGPLAFVALMAIIAGSIPFFNERAGYVVSGFLAGGFFLADYYVPNFIAIPILPFIFGGSLGAIIMGVLTEWALMAVSSLVGAIYAIDIFTINSPALRLMLTGGLFLAGALTQVVMRRMQHNAE